MRFGSWSAKAALALAVGSLTLGIVGWTGSRAAPVLAASSCAVASNALDSEEQAFVGQLNAYRAQYGAGTLNDYRRRGLQTAMLEKRMQAAAEAGCEYAVIVTQGGTTSQCNAERMGFRVA